MNALNYNIEICHLDITRWWLSTFILVSFPFRRFNFHVILNHHTHNVYTKLQYFTLLLQEHYWKTNRMAYNNFSTLIFITNAPIANELYGESYGLYKIGKQMFCKMFENLQKIIARDHLRWHNTIKNIYIRRKKLLTIKFIEK